VVLKWKNFNNTSTCRFLSNRIQEQMYRNPKGAKYIDVKVRQSYNEWPRDGITMFTYNFIQLLFSSEIRENIQNIATLD
jgi:hypothetical protein